MKNIILLIILTLYLKPVYSQTDTIPKSVVIINDTIKYLMTSNKLLTKGINEYYKQIRIGQQQTLIGTTLVTIGTLFINPTFNRPIEKLPYILITTGLTFNIAGSINRYTAHKHLNLN
tara:strand:- start:528 stop:881 length:354 start_codon:yes stop_codon:yes gene_type:complete